MTLDEAIKHCKEKAIVADYYETVAEARSTYVRTEASKIWLADAIIDLFKDEFKEAENE